MQDDEHGEHGDERESGDVAHHHRLAERTPVGVGTGRQAEQQPRQAAGEDGHGHGHGHDRAVADRGGVQRQTDEDEAVAELGDAGG